MDIAIYKLNRDGTLEFGLDNIDEYITGPAAIAQQVTKAMLTITGSVVFARGWGSGRSLWSFIRGTHAKPSQATRSQVAAMVSLAEKSILREQPSGLPASETLVKLELRDVQIFSDLSIKVLIAVKLSDGNSFVVSVPMAR